MKTEWLIRLTPTEMMLANYVGGARNVQAMFRRWRDPTSETADRWGGNIEGAGAEIAVCKHLGIYYHPIIGNPDADDAGPYQVRCNCSRRLEDLNLRTEDKERPNRVFISVLAGAPAEFKAVGWIWGYDGMKSEWLHEGSPGRGLSWWVPRSILEDLNDLPDIVAAKKFA